MCRSHSGFEWLLDLIREAESLDHALPAGRRCLQVQLYVTAPPEQFDLRTAIDVSSAHRGSAARLRAAQCGRPLISFLFEPH